MLALSLARRGIAFRIVDAAEGPGAYSRAMVVHARTLEFYRQFGFADEVVGEGMITDVVHLREKMRDGAFRDVLRVPLGDMGCGLSPFPFMLTYPQDLHERLLLRHLAALGISVERETMLTALEQHDDGVRVTLAGPKGETRADFAHVCGCDGAHSRVRTATGVGFAGGTYVQPFFVADVRLEGAFDRDLYVHLGENEIDLMFPVRSTGMHRFLGLVPPALAEKEDIGFADMQGQIEAMVGQPVTGSELVRALPGASPRGDRVPDRPCVSSGGRGAPAQPGRRSGDEYRHRRRESIWAGSWRRP